MAEMKNLTINDTEFTLPFAPSGYGLGVIRGLDAPYGSANYCKNGGFWIASEDCAHPGVFHGITIPGGNSLTQIAVDSTNHKGCITIRQCSDDTSGEWEHFNPPMVLGVEYRTTERWQGKPVYTMLVDCGEAVNGKLVTAISQTVCTIRALGVSYDGSVYRPLPYIAETLTSEHTCHICVANGAIGIYCGAAAAGNTIYVQLWYTK